MKWKPPQEWSGTTAFSKELYLPPAQNPLCFTRVAGREPAWKLWVLFPSPGALDVAHQGEMFTTEQKFLLCADRARITVTVFPLPLTMPSKSFSYPNLTALQDEVCLSPPHLYRTLSASSLVKAFGDLSKWQEPNSHWNSAGAKRPLWLLWESQLQGPVICIKPAPEHFPQVSWTFLNREYHK